MILSTDSPKKLLQFYECGLCQHYHSALFWQHNCGHDEARFSKREDLDDEFGKRGWTAVPMPGTSGKYLTLAGRRLLITWSVNVFGSIGILYLVAQIVASLYYHIQFIREIVDVVRTTIFN
jgi:hypothetical protein